ncbi:Methyltransferase type 12 [Candidatus Competibacter denitrificans Run_A_D11]|uniref:Methyltransferase type 12 n=1 Tax=Candidatus Competibacter denitrificans Run_A_D11 TaxID=1400863 RepID=W6M5Q4_9GAMM|nr:methyltransferase domain-containing protein [Candidatus Competibacter denitrificans]CDI01085.1 Methyltransferase type 12 [Candidatus Competibacter denitrificans Run_A_D11]
MNRSEPLWWPTERQTDPLSRYYRWHARLYDATRWSFLFGRAQLIQAIATDRQPRRILEIGCGTGANLLRLSRQFPNAQITGLDLSADMLAQARRKLAQRASAVTLLQQRYDRPLSAEPAFDLIVCSYCLSMIDPGWQQALDAALGDLQPGGLLAVVDFHDTRFSGFRRWMGFNHVRMDGHLLPSLNERSEALTQNVRPAYGNVWRYFSFIGCKRGS